MNYFDYRKMLSIDNLKKLFFWVVVGLLLMALFSGKKRVELGTIAVSPDEQYIACNESFEWLGKGNRWEKIRCFQTDGSFAFQYDIPSDISAGGVCALWFDEDVLCAYFYRTDKIVQFAMDGNILDIIVDTSVESPARFPSFTKSGHQYVYRGKEINVVYEKRGFLRYWFFGAERYLAITPKDGETEIVWSGTAASGITQR